MIESSRGGPPRACVTESAVADTTFKWALRNPPHTDLASKVIATSIK